MSRPRLVQEGTPIYGPGSEAEVVDHAMDDDRGAFKNEKSEEMKVAPVSSLQRAASGSKKTKRRSGSTASYRFVVGGCDEPSPQQPPQFHRDDPSPKGRRSSYRYSKQSHSADVGSSHEMEIDNNSYVESPGYRSHYSNRPRYNATPPLHHHQAQHFHQIGNQQPPAPPLYHAPSTEPSHIQTSFEIGADTRPVEKMEGVEDHGTKLPLVVLDGANVAHAYTAGNSSLQAKTTDADARGILVATEYFQAAGVRVLVVLPQYWFRSTTNKNGSSSLSPHLEALEKLQSQGLLVASPPADDDDAYALTIAKREEGRSLRRRNGEGPGFVVSNDMFRDAQNRDTSGALKAWLNDGRNETIGAGRISYTYCDMGTMNDHGERILDFVPNPRHPLVIWMEGQLVASS